MINKYKIRVKRHKLYKKVVTTIIKLMALRILKLGHWEIKITNNKEGIDHYSYCKHSEKQYCTRKKYWQAYLTRRDSEGKVSGGYIVLGTYKEELYLEIIKLLLIHETIFPFCR